MQLEKQIKAIFLDVDHTSYDHTHKEVRPLTLYAVKELKKNGYKIVISTSRNYDELLTINHEFIELADVVCTLAGARTIYKDTIDSYPINQKDINKLVDYFNKKHITYRYALNNGIGYLNQNDEYVEGIFFKYFDMIPEIKPYQNEEILQIMYYTFDTNIHEQIRALVPSLVVNNMKLNNEISSNNIDKGSVMKKICEYLNCDLNEVMSFGDSENDITMMKNSFFSVCMGNGTEIAKENASYVCEDITQDGLYKTLVKYNFIDEYKEENKVLFSEVIQGMKDYYQDKSAIDNISKLFVDTIKNGGVIQMIGTSYNGQFAQELFYRAGGLVPFHKIDLLNNETLESIYDRYKLDDRDLFLFISDKVDENILIELSKYLKNNNQKIITLGREFNDENVVVQNSDVVYKLKDNINPIQNTIDDTFAQLLSFRTYELLEEENIDPPVFMSNNNPDAKEHNQKVLEKYGRRVHE